MAKIKSIDRHTCGVLRERLNVSLEKLGDQLGLQITVGRGSYTHGHVTFKVECAVISPEGVPMTKVASDFQARATSYGLSPSDLNRSFQIAGDTYTLIGLAIRNRKCPFLCRKASDEQVYKMSERNLKYGLGCLADALVRQ